MNRAGCAWLLLAHDFPQYRTVYGYYARSEKDGTTEAIHDLLRRKVREQAGRADGRDPRRQGGQDLINVPEANQGHDAGKRTKGGSSI